jgi:hypothetical protein
MAVDQHPARRSGAYPDAAGADVVLAYRKGPLLADYLRAAAGLALAGVPLVTMEPSWPIAIGLIALIALFLVFLLQTRRRQHAHVSLRPDGITLVEGLERHLAWRELDALRLRWFGSRRQGRGWMELELRGAGQRLVLTSALDGFDGIVAQAVHAAEANAVPLEPATLANVATLLGRGKGPEPPRTTRPPGGSSAPRA